VSSSSITPTSRDAVEHQDQSIKVRKSQLFEAAQPAGPATAAVKPFAEYVRETPAAPLSPGVKAWLWGVAALVALLFLAALLFGPGHRAPRHRRADRPNDRPVAVVLRARPADHGAPVQAAASLMA
jgi:hypothetical protein